MQTNQKQQNKNKEKKPPKRIQDTIVTATMEVVCYGSKMNIYSRAYIHNRCSVKSPYANYKQKEHDEERENKMKYTEIKAEKKNNTLKNT